MTRATKTRIKIPRPLQPTAIEMSYGRVMIDIVEELRREIDAVLMPRLPGIVGSVRREMGLDAGAQDIGQLISEIAVRLQKRMLDRAGLESLLRMYAGRIDAHQKANIIRQLSKRFGLNILSDAKFEPLAKNFVATNVALIQDIPRKALADIEGTILRSISHGTRHEAMVPIIAERLGVATSRAKLIARDQVLSLNAQLNNHRLEALGFDGYIWRTVRDQRVRPHHRDLEGRQFTWDKPPSAGPPGTEILCRCFAEPVGSE